MGIQEQETQYFFHTYKRIPLEIERGEGVHLFGKDGKRYLDMFSGLAVNALGYGHHKIIAAIEKQARAYIHLSNYYLQEPQVELAGLLIRHSGYRKVFFSNRLSIFFLKITFAFHFSEESHSTLYKISFCTSCDEI